MSLEKALTIPEKYPRFEGKTLIACLAHYMAKPYLCEGDTISPLQEIATPDTDVSYSDNEGFQRIKGAGNRATVPGEAHNKEHYKQVFFNYLADQLVDLDSHHHFASIILFVPDDFKAFATQKLHEGIQEKTTILSGSVVNMHPLELLDRIHGA